MEEVIGSTPESVPEIASVTGDTKRVCTKSLIVYLTQVSAILLIIAVSIVNLSINKDDKEVWLTLLATSLGYLLPHPNVKKLRVKDGVTL